LTPLHEVLELSETIRQIEAAENNFKKRLQFEVLEILCDLKLKKAEAIVRLIKQ